jgi:hypothetical protein
LFFFSTIAPYIRIPLANIGNPVVEGLIYIVVSVILCSYPVIRFVKGVNKRTILARVVLLTLSVAGVMVAVIWWWRPYYMAPEPFRSYAVVHPDDDTLRVVMIGDSWVYFHETLRRDSTFE